MSFLKRFRSTSKRDSTLTPTSPLANAAARLSEIQASAASFRSSETSRPAFLNPSPATRRPEAPPAYSGPPPSYSTTDPNASASITPTPAVQRNSDDQLSFLSHFDTAILIDDSGSMAGRSWRETGEALEIIIPIVTKYDADGIDLYFLNAPQVYRGIKSVDQVRQIFREVRPYGGTPTAMRLSQILRPYLRELTAEGPDNKKPLNIICITDGVPSDPLEETIKSAARKLESLDAPSWQVGIQFFQVGNEQDAGEYLRQLDDDLTKAASQGSMDCPRDIVDTVPFSRGGALSADGILKVVLGAVHKGLDGKRNSSEQMRTQ